MAFENYYLLADWAQKHNLGEPKIADPARLVSAVKLVGQFHHPDWLPNHYLSYQQLWVRKSYKAYRPLMKEFMRDLVKDEDALWTVDADHVVGRTILESFPDAWINLFRVWGTANQSFGSIERCAPKAQTGFGTIFLTSLTAFKLLRNDKKIETKADLMDEIEVAASKMRETNEVAIKIRHEIGPAVNRAYENWLAHLPARQRTAGRTSKAA